jgi:hypothetical protein
MDGGQAQYVQTLLDDYISQGAHAARVSYYIDLILANSSPDAQTDFQVRMSAFEEFAGQAKSSN